MRTRVEFRYTDPDAEGRITVRANAWIGEPDQETALGPWHSEEYTKKRLALEELVEVLLNEICSGELRFQLASNSGYFERGSQPEEEQDRVLGKTLRELWELRDENDRLDKQLQEARSEHEETKRLLREAYLKTERLGGCLAQVRAITEKDT